MPPDPSRLPEAGTQTVFFSKPSRSTRAAAILAAFLLAASGSPAVGAPGPDDATRARGKIYGHLMESIALARAGEFSEAKRMTLVR